jgi:hypothetical protein
MHVCNVVLIEVLTKLHRVVWNSQTPFVAILDECVQQAPLKEELPWMVAKRGHHPAFVHVYNIRPKYLRNQLPLAIALSSENEFGMWPAEVFADWRYEVPKLIQGNAIYYLNAFVRGNVRATFRTRQLPGGA